MFKHSIYFFYIQLPGKQGEQGFQGVPGRKGEKGEKGDHYDDKLTMLMLGSK